MADCHNSERLSLLLSLRYLIYNYYLVTTAHRALYDPRSSPPPLSECERMTTPSPDLDRRVPSIAVPASRPSFLNAESRGRSPAGRFLFCGSRGTFHQAKG